MQKAADRFEEPEDRNRLKATRRLTGYLDVIESQRIRLPGSASFPPTSCNGIITIVRKYSPSECLEQAQALLGRGSVRAGRPRSVRLQAHDVV